MKMLGTGLVTELIKLRIKVKGETYMFVKTVRLY